jgi:hypothetical protein
MNTRHIVSIQEICYSLDPECSPKSSFAEDLVSKETKELEILGGGS